MSGIIKNVITFGASGRIDKKIDEHEELVNQYKEKYSIMELKSEEVNKSFEKVIEKKVNSVSSLKKINQISKNIQMREREFDEEILENDLSRVDFDSIESTISLGESAISASKGVSTGISTAMGAWALVSTLGTASTGTAIAGLSGVAATNATLAWFGGGAIAAGGGGMALGTMVIGGIVAVPALALTGVFNHINANKKIKEIEEEIVSLLKYIDQVESNILHLDLLILRSEEICISLDKAIEAFDIEFSKVYKKIYPYGIFSKIYKVFRMKFLKRNYYSDCDKKEIAYIGGLATNFAKIIDTKIIE